MDFVGQEMSPTGSIADVVSFVQEQTKRDYLLDVLSDALGSAKQEVKRQDHLEGGDSTPGSFYIPRVHENTVLPITYTTNTNITTTKQSSLGVPSPPSYYRQGGVVHHHLVCKSPKTAPNESPVVRGKMNIKIETTPRNDQLLPYNYETAYARVFKQSNVPPRASLLSPMNTGSHGLHTRTGGGGAGGGGGVVVMPGSPTSYAPSLSSSYLGSPQNQTLPMAVPSGGYGGDISQISVDIRNHQKFDDHHYDVLTSGYRSPSLVQVSYTPTYFRYSYTPLDDAASSEVAHTLLEGSATCNAPTPMAPDPRIPMMARRVPASPVHLGHQNSLPVLSSGNKALMTPGPFGLSFSTPLYPSQVSSPSTPQNRRWVVTQQSYMPQRQQQLQPPTPAVYPQPTPVQFNGTHPYYMHGTMQNVPQPPYESFTRGVGGRLSSCRRLPPGCVLPASAGLVGY